MTKADAARIAAELTTPEKNVGVIQLFFIDEAGYSLL
jgi:hypothetical protein